MTRARAAVTALLVAAAVASSVLAQAPDTTPPTVTDVTAGE